LRAFEKCLRDDKNLKHIPQRCQITLLGRIGHSPPPAHGLRFDSRRIGAVRDHGESGSSAKRFQRSESRTGKRPSDRPRSPRSGAVHGRGGQPKGSGRVVLAILARYLARGPPAPCAAGRMLSCITFRSSIAPPDP
jgi:hypothetical protein